MSFTSNEDSIPAARADGWVPLEVLERALRYGWLVIVLVIVGGLAGWGIYHVQPPLYEARFGFTVSYDLTNMGEMTQYEQDFTSGAVGDLMYASDILEKVAERAQAQGVQIDPQELRKISTRERQAQTWYVRVRHTNPDTAALLATVWGEEVDRVLRQVYQEGVKAQGLQRYLESLEDCLKRTALIEPVMQECSAQNLPALQQELNATGQALAAAKLASRGVLPSLGISWTEKAARPDRPVLLGLGQMVLAGGASGFLLAVVFIETGLAGRLMGRLRGG